MTSRISIALCSLLLTACATNGVGSTASTPAVCEALRPAMPIAYHGNSDTADTIARIRAANARFAAACPV